MKTLEVFNASDRVPTDYIHRPTVKVVVFDDHGRIALFPGLPGGGVEEDETLDDAIHRECMEELGMTMEIIEPLGIVEQYRDAIKRHYVIHGFLARKQGELVAPTSPDEDDIQSAFQEKLKWLPIDEAITFTNMRIEMLEQGVSYDPYDPTRKEDYFQSRIYNAKTVLLFLEIVKNNNTPRPA